MSRSTALNPAKPGFGKKKKIKYNDGFTPALLQLGGKGSSAERCLRTCVTSLGRGGGGGGSGPRWAPAYTGGNPGQCHRGPWAPRSQAGPTPTCPNWEPSPSSICCHCPPGNRLLSVQGVEEPSLGKKVLGILGLLSLSACWCWTDTSLPVPRIYGAAPRVFPRPPPNLCCPRAGGRDTVSLQGMASPRSSSPSSSSVQSARGRWELVGGADPHLEREEHRGAPTPRRSLGLRPGPRGCNHAG